MKKTIILSLYFFICLLLLPSLFLSPVHAQEGSTNYGIAITYKVIDKNFQDGDIVSLSDQNEVLALSKKDYDERMFGVIMTNPVMVFRRPIDNGVPIFRNGQVFINVTNVNGDILNGDFVTASAIPGKAMKATSINSYVLGIALSNFDKSSGTQIDYKGRKVTEGKVLIALGIGPASPILSKAQGGLFGTLRNLVRALFFNINTTQATDRIIRYILALLIVLITAVLNYRTFGRNISKGIEAIGRNPLAKKSIQTMIIINGVLIAMVTLAGVILALAVISL